MTVPECQRQNQRITNTTKFIILLIIEDNLSQLAVGEELVGQYIQKR